MDKSVQEMMDKRMCRPGCRWNDTLKRCLCPNDRINDLISDIEPPPGQKPGVPAQPAEGKGGRGSKRVNAAGIQQTGTKMGGKVSIK